MLAPMKPMFLHAIPVLPAVSIAASVQWWVEVCGFSETFRHGEPPTYAGLKRGPVLLNLVSVDGPELARTVAEQTMIRFSVSSLDALYAEYQARGGLVHPNGALRQQPWGGRAFDAIDPAGVCVTFTES